MGINSLLMWWFISEKYKYLFACFILSNPDKTKIVQIFFWCYIDEKSAVAQVMALLALQQTIAWASDNL